MSFGPNMAAIGQMGARLVDKVLKGEKQTFRLKNRRTMNCG
jgi:hypothetical protein